MKILVTPTSMNPSHPSPALERLEAFADEIVYNPHARPLEEGEVIRLAAGCDGYIAGLDRITGRAIRACGGLRVISRYGAGTDRVDLDAARERGVVVRNTPGANAQAVADLTFGLILSVARRIPLLDSKTKAGEWARSTGTEIYGKTMGILGLGAVGKAVAQRARGFSMRVLAYDPYLDAEYAEARGIGGVALEELARQADVICLHLPLMDSTRHIVDAALMETMRPGAIIVNTARGGLIDEAAAYRLLVSGRLGGLGLDAYESEPPGESPLFALDSVVATPHAASHTREAAQNMANMAVDNLIRALEGEK
jgi:D-3-phosphoglycerate dehydrogenase